MRTRIKICGVTTKEAAICAGQSGADAVGLNFYRPSSRFIELEKAAAVRSVIPAFVASVAVFVNPDPDLVRECIRQVGIDVLQFHGDESPEFCGAFDRPYIKALRVDTDTDVGAVTLNYTDATAILLDSKVGEHYGGTGERFDWDLARRGNINNLVLAGGLDAGNVAEAIKAVRPYAVDACSGIETDGKKDLVKIRDFCQSVRDADRQGEAL